MKSLHKQAGWYTGALMFAIVVAALVFISQPWIPLLLGAAVLVALAVVGASHGAEHLSKWYHDRHPEAHE